MLTKKERVIRLILQKQVEKVYREQMVSRQEIDPAVAYFSAKDFDGLQKEPYLFDSSGKRLQGYFYFYPSPEKHRIVIFDHGMGAGHRAYMKEIDQLARHGYLVFAYDHTGCVESEGAHTNGFAQSLADLDACIRSLKSDHTLKNRCFSVVGHSWGAFAAQNITAFHPDVTHVVAISGYISVEAIVSQNFDGLLKPFRKGILAIERDANPDYVSCNAAHALASTTARVLIIHSDDDPLVKKELHFDVLQQALAGKENIRFLLTTGKKHNPNYTADAVKYKDVFFEILTKKAKANELNTEDAKRIFRKSFDWHRMTAQDKDFWREIFTFLDT